MLTRFLLATVGIPRVAGSWSWMQARPPAGKAASGLKVGLRPRHSDCYLSWIVADNSSLSVNLDNEQPAWVRGRCGPHPGVVHWTTARCSVFATGRVGRCRGERC
ncbi:hypothetical protein QBC39DRAFT_339293 [Podospora conica]|nr:hypothetical protein QBC39DRAFT_339293 [Schizothecium conicum]